MPISPRTAATLCIALHRRAGLRFAARRNAIARPSDYWGTPPPAALRGEAGDFSAACRIARRRHSMRIVVALRNPPHCPASQRIALPSPAPAINGAPQLLLQVHEPSRGKHHRCVKQRLASQRHALQRRAPHRSPIVRRSRLNRHPQHQQPYVVKLVIPTLRPALHRCACHCFAPFSHRPPVTTKPAFQDRKSPRRNSSHEARSRMPPFAR